MGRQDGAHRLWPLLPLLLGYLTRFCGLGVESIWLDEVTSLVIARLDIPSVVAWAAGDIHPPLYYVLLHFWLYLGESEYAIRALSALLGVACIAVAFALARELWDEHVALLSALLLSLSPMHIWYSQEARMYGMATLLSLLSSYLLLLALTRQRAGYWTGYVLAALMAVYSHYFTLFVFLFQAAFALYWLRQHGTRRTWRAWLASQICIVVLFLPWVPIAYHQVTTGGGGWVEKTVGRPSFLALGDTFISFSVGLVRPPYPAMVRRLAYGLFGICTLAGCALALSPSRRTAALFSIGYVALPIGTAWLLSQVKPMYSIRYLLLFLPGYCILVASGIARGLRGPARAALAGAVILVLAAGVVNAALTLQNPDWRGLTAHIVEEAAPGDVVLFSPRWNQKPVEYYSRGRIELNMDLPIPVTQQAARRVVDDLASRYRRVWLVWEQGHYSDPLGIAKSVLDVRGCMVTEQGFRGLSRLMLYELAPPAGS